jgi:hypothetical protein
MQEQQMAWIGRQGRKRLAGTVGKCRSSRWLGLEDREGKG